MTWTPVRRRCFAALLAATASCAWSAGGFDAGFGEGGLAVVPDMATPIAMLAQEDGSLVATDGRRVVTLDRSGKVVARCDLPLPAGEAVAHAVFVPGPAIVASSFASGSALGSLRRYDTACALDASYQRVDPVGRGLLAAWPNGEVIFSASTPGPFFISDFRFTGLSTAGRTTFVSTGWSSRASEVAILPGPARTYTVVFDHQPFGSGFASVDTIRYRLGAIDPTFAGNGVENAYASHAALSPDGPVYVTSGANVFRTTAAGVRDTAFGYGGARSFAMPVGPLIVQPDGQVVAALDGAERSSLVRFDPAGRIDPSLGSDGTIPLPAAIAPRTLAFAADGTLLVGGVVDGAMAFARVSLGTVAVVEYFHATLDHYFVTSNPNEIRDLDLGRHEGWLRTGLVFRAFGAADAATMPVQPVCRYYIPPQHGNSHFYSASPAECDAIAQRATTDPSYSGYVREWSDAFYVGVPDVFGGCVPGTTQVYRVWNGRFDSNHRYTTDPSVYAQMLARGYVSEGVVMCAPLR